MVRDEAVRAHKDTVGATEDLDFLRWVSLALAVLRVGLLFQSRFKQIEETEVFPKMINIHLV